MKSNKKISRKSRGKKAMTKKQVNAVKSIIKKEVKKTEETKFFKSIAAFNIAGGNNTTSYNIFAAGVSHGTGNNNFLGDKIRWKGLAIKYAVVNGSSGVAGITYYDQPVVIDIMVICTDKYKVSTSLTFADVFNESSTDPNVGFFNSSTKCLFKRTLRITPAIRDDYTTNGVQQKLLTGKIWVKRNQLIEYKDFATDYNLKKGLNYYIMLINRSPSPNNSYVAMSWQNYFTDA